MPLTRRVRIKPWNQIVETFGKCLTHTWRVELEVALPTDRIIKLSKTDEWQVKHGCPLEFNGWFISRHIIEYEFPTRRAFNE